MEFTATEAGFKEGVGGASNSKSAGRYHYVLFGTQADAQHPENSGAYFEYDDQSKGAVNSVKTVSVGDKSIIFKLNGRKSIKINCGVSAEEWRELKSGIRTVFQKKAKRK